MAFFGLQWVPGQEQKSKASEASPAELAGLSYSIRTSGRNSAIESYGKLYSTYTLEYAAYAEKQTQAQAWKSYIDSRLPSFTGKEAEQVQAAAIAWRNMSPEFYTHHDSLSEAGKALVQEYYQFLEAIEIQETAEAKLWDLSACLENTQRLQSLWEFESESAEAQETNLKLKQKEQAKKQADLLRLSAAQAAKARKISKRNIFYRAIGGGVQQQRAADIRHSQINQEAEITRVLSGLEKIGGKKLPVRDRNVIKQHQTQNVSLSKMEPKTWLGTWISKPTPPKSIRDFV